MTSVRTDNTLAEDLEKVYATKMEDINVPGRDDEAWRVHTLARVNGRVELAYRPVHLNPLIGHNEGGIDLEKIAPKARVY